MLIIQYKTLNQVQEDNSIIYLSDPQINNLVTPQLNIYLFLKNKGE